MPNFTENLKKIGEKYYVFEKDEACFINNYNNNMNK